MVALLFGRRRLMFTIFVALALVLTFVHLAGYTSWKGLYPIPRPPTATVEEIPASFTWETVPVRYPIKSMTPLPTEKAANIPRIQHDFRQTSQSEAQRETRKDRLKAVKEAFQHTWNGYKEHAWGHDEVAPLSATPKDTFGGWGATLVDSLDTMWIMGLTAEFEEAVETAKNIDFTQSTIPNINVFETTIRYLGGFLSAYDLTSGKYPVLLDKAIQVGNMLYRAFDTPNHMPHTRWNWKSYVRGMDQNAPENAVLAEIGSLSLEFTRLSQVTSDPKYFDLVQRITDLFFAQQNSTLLPGLWPVSLNLRLEDLHSDNAFTLGAMSDSTYEYLPKEYILLGGRDDHYRIMHQGAAEAIKKYLLFEPLVPPPPSQSAFNAMGKSPLLSGFVRVWHGGTPSLEPRHEHLTCFAGGMFGLGARAMASVRSAAQTAEDLEVARRLTQGCVWAYASTPSGIGPETFRTFPCRKGRDAVTGGDEPDWDQQRGDCSWTREKWLDNVMQIPQTPEERERFVKERELPEGFTEASDRNYKLRPEAIESVFMMYRLTGDTSWHDHAWQMFQHILTNCKTTTAFAGLKNVMDSRPGALSQDDSMESFWTGETLKYFYLIFADEELVSLDEFVFNTEAHPFRWRTAVPFSG